VDGNDLEEVYTTAQIAVDRARAGRGPSLIEAITYRHKGHSRTDPAKYRSSDEVAEWLERDPITAFRRRLEESGWEAATLDAVEQAVVLEVEEAAERALASPPPGDEELYSDVYAAEGTSWRN
jgi:pyruvate dehydrogenase E1 component alpha subunit